MNPLHVEEVFLPFETVETSRVSRFWMRTQRRMHPPENEKDSVC